MHKIAYTSFDSCIGTIQVASTEKGVCKIGLPGLPRREFLRWLQKHYPGFELVENAAANRQVIDELNRYFSRRLVKFHSKIDLCGTDFQLKVWEALKRVRYGSTISYKKLAAMAGMKSGFQAVGGANGANPVPIIIPCHRVIGSDHSLTGYAGGLKTKEFLLRLEGALPVE